MMLEADISSPAVAEPPSRHGAKWRDGCLAFLSLLVTTILFSTAARSGEKETKAIAESFPMATVIAQSAGIINGKKHMAAALYDENRKTLQSSFLGRTGRIATG
jgi:hypothetical protein